MPEEKLRYTISIKNGGYNTVTKDFTRAQFDAYYDGVVAKGGKVIGFTTKEVDTK